MRRGLRFLCLRREVRRIGRGESRRALLEDRSSPVRSRPVRTSNGLHPINRDIVFSTDLASEARAIFLDFTCVDRTIIEGGPYPGNLF